ncbi:zinc finger BED domain-containing protein 1-like [Rhizophagus irregularis DAOM 181602=DAOM 197198]|nr:zinc finger BED domain-containing protein 1-like [Rhizophagus irregularis DAOM 181602=DAOM 197198]
MISLKMVKTIRFVKDPDNQVTKSHKHYSAKNQEECWQYLVDWIVDDIQLISVVANLKFCQLINQLNPTFVMPCPETVKAYVKYPHTSQHILETLEEILKEWKIRELVFTATTDNSSNVKKAILDMKNVNCLRCTAYILQLVVGKGMKSAENPEKISEYLHVISDSPTRWNSSYLAWQRLLKLKNHIIMLINTLTTKNDLDSKKEATELLGGSSYCTHSMMNPILINIKKRFHPSTSCGVAAAEKININFGDNDTAFDEDMAVEENE